MRYAALHTGPEFHLLDHIAPLADLLQMPLLITEELSRDLAFRYYPQVDSHYFPDLEFQFGALAERFDVLFSCKFWELYHETLFEQLYHKKMRLVFCPHGQSDKGFQAPLLAPYASQQVVLLYGQLLIQMLKELQIWPSISCFATLGNYRLAFYRKYQTFYDQLVEREYPLNREHLTLLYAPTWQDADNSTSFFDQGREVMEELPSDWNLILKVHPFLEQRDPAAFYALEALAEKKPNIFLVHAFPPVYPLLSQADLYLGDASSVGYDFLVFERPMYFFPTAHPGQLQTCGEILDPTQNLYRQMERKQEKRKEQRALYQLAFGALQSEEETRSRIASLLAK